MVAIMRHENESVSQGMKRIKIPEHSSILQWPEAQERTCIDVPKDWSESKISEFLEDMETA